MINQMFKRPLSACAASLVAGILCSLQFHMEFPASAALAGLAVFLLRILHPSAKGRKTAVLFCCVFLFFLIGFFRAGIVTKQFQNADLSAFEKLTVAGTVSKIEPRKNSVYLYLSDVRLTVPEQLMHDAAEKTATGKVQEDSEGWTEIKVGSYLLLLSGDVFVDVPLRIGNRIRAEGDVLALSEPRNHGNFNEKTYYHSLGIAGKAKASELEVTDGRYRILAQRLFEMKQKLTESISKAAGDESAAVFLAIVAGDRTQLSDETKTLFRESGIAHILAISGLHISLIGMTLFKLLRKRLCFLPSAGFSCLLLLLFCVMTGPQVSSLRAIMMFAIALLASGSGKTYDLLSALSVSAFLLLSAQPYYLTNTGFLLSFGAVFAVAVPGKKLQQFTGCKSRFVKTFLVSLSIALVTLPIIANSYYQIPVYAVLLNLFVIPLLSLVLGSGILSGLFGLLSLVLGRFFLGFGIYVLFFIEGLADVILLFPGSVVTTGHLSLQRTVGYYFFLGFLYFLCVLAAERKRGRAVFPNFRMQLKRGTLFCQSIRMLLAGVLLAAALCCIMIKPRGDDLQITFFDVDQGESILMQNGSGKTWMIDAGSTGVDQVWKYRIESAVKYLGVDSLDYVIITHPDEDHINGLLEALASSHRGKIRIHNILIPAVSGSEVVEQLQHTALEEGIGFYFLHTGMGFQDEGLSLRFLHPDVSFVSTDTNAYSAVCELCYGDFRALFTGDLDEAGEKALVSAGLLAHCDLLKVAHHGSKYSSCDEFLSAVSPDVAVISAGVRNPYGHPHAETLNRLAAYMEKIYATNRCGEIQFRIDGKKAEISTMF